MASLEKLVRAIDQIKIIESSNSDPQVKKKELRVHLLNIIESSSNSNVQNHKDFVVHIGPSIDSLIRLCDSKDSDIRLASDEGLYKVIKALLPLHSNRVLVELCKQIKKCESPRILKLSMNRFAELCHLARPQKRRAYLANLFNAISAIANRKEEMLHESLSNFVSKVFHVMGQFAFENETKTLLKVFLTNLASTSPIIRRCASNAITVITSTNRKSDVLLALVVEYLTDQILLSAEDIPMTDAPVIAGTLLTLKLLLPLFQSTCHVKEDPIIAFSSQLQKANANMNAVALERIVQIFELAVHYSFSSDHNVVNASLELLQQLLKMRTLVLAIPVLRSVNGLQGTRISLRGLTKANSQWNLVPLPVAEESLLLEVEVPLGEFDKTNVESIDGDAEVADDMLGMLSIKEQELSNSRVLTDTDNPIEEKEFEESFLEQESVESIISPEQVLNIGTLYDKKSCSPLLYCARHLAYNFLLTDKKGQMKSDRAVRVSVKSLAINCLALVGSLEPSIWNSYLSESEERKIPIMDVLLYSTHDDPQLRGQVSLLACMVLSSMIDGCILTIVETKNLVKIVEETLNDRETSACRLALQGMNHFLPMAIEGPFCKETVPLLHSLLKLSENPYWLVRVDLLEVFGSFSWTALEFGLNSHQASLNLPKFQETFLHKVILTMIGDEDYRVRSAVASCICSLAKSWTTTKIPPDVARANCLESALYNSTPLEPPLQTFIGVPVAVNGLAEAYRDVPSNQNIVDNLSYFVNEIFLLLVSSNSKFIKMGCLQALSNLSTSYPPTAYMEVYGCNSKGNCSILKVCLALMTNSTLMLDLATHQTLLTLATKLFSGCVKGGLGEVVLEKDAKEWRFLNDSSATYASSLLSHTGRILNAFCCVLEDINPFTVPIKTPLVTLPTPSALSPIRRKLRSGEQNLEKEEKSEEFSRKWNKPTQLLNPSNLGFFVTQPLYTKLFDLLKGTHATCKLNFDTVTSERLSSFLQSALEALATLIEVSVFQDIGKFSEEILYYLRIIIITEPVSCLHNVQQLLKALFGANLAAVWHGEATRFKRSNISSTSSAVNKSNVTLYSSFGLDYNCHSDATRQMSFSRMNEKPNLITKFRISNKIGPDKTALSSYIRLFEPMVIKALKLYTVTACPHVQKQVLDLLCELIHLCVNYCLLDADQVFLNFVIQQFEFLEEGFIPQVETLLPSMFRFLSLLSYDRFHSKTIISVPRIMQLAGGLMATGKDAQLHVLPTLRPMVEDLFLSRERMSDNFKELETQKEVLINILLRLVQYHKVYPLITAILLQVQFENANKWKSLSKQICDSLVPQLHRHTLFLDSDVALQLLHKLISHLDPSIVHESLLGLLQTFAPKQQLEDFSSSTVSDYHRVLACRLTVFETLVAVFDEAFLLDCLNEFNLSYLVNQRSDPLNVTPTENSPPEHILSSLLLDTLKLALSHWRSKVTADSSAPKCVSWRIDSCSFSVHLVLDLISLSRRLLSSRDFPVLQEAIRTELSRDEYKIPIFQKAKDLIPNNPIVFVRICALLSSEICSFPVDDMTIPFGFGGINGSIAQAGFFLVLCSSSFQESTAFLAFVRLHSKNILNYFGEAPVQNLLRNLPDKNDSYIYELLKCVLSLHGNFLVVSAFSFMSILEFVPIKKPEDVLLEVVSSFQSIQSGIVHTKICEIILNWNFVSHESKHRILKDVCRIIRSSTYRRYYNEVIDMSESNDDNVGKSLSLIDKAFVLDFAFSRRPEICVWRDIITHVDTGDLPGLFSIDECLLYALGSCRKFKYDIFVRAKEYLFQEIAGEIPKHNNKIFRTARVLTGLCKSIYPSEVNDLFTESEISTLAKMSLAFLGAMGPLYHSLVLLKASSEIASIFFRELPVEWTDKDNLPAVYKAINCLEILCTQLRNDTSLAHATVTGFEEMDYFDSKFVQSALQLNRLVTFIEQQSYHIPRLLHQYLRSIVIVFCRMPLFYSYTCIPPSVWGKGWNPNLVLDMEHIKMDLPVIPSHFLHDEIVLKEFVFRIDQISWISRQKFEEIWMTLLGILNLYNEDQVRPEEQASVIQATCEAVRALTMVLQKNLPFQSTTSTSNNDLEDPDFMLSERGKKLKELRNLLNKDSGTAPTNESAYRLNRLCFRHIQFNIDQGSPSKKKSASPEEVTHIDIQSCVRFLVDLYSQWLQNSNTPYPLLVDLFRSLFHISNFFVDAQQFEWMLDNALSFHKQVLPDDPASLESALIGCILKSASFIQMSTECWEQIKKLCEIALSSQHISTRASGLEGLLYLLQKFTRNPDASRSNMLVNLVMDYAGKYLGPENIGPHWHQSWLWSIAFYCSEHYAILPYHNYSVADFVVQCALNGLMEGQQQSIEIQKEILQGLERLCILGVLSPNWRTRVKTEILNIIRRVDREWILQPALQTLLSLVYSDLGSQLYKPGADPETWLVAMEWVGALFQRMKRGTDAEAEVFGQVLPTITCDIFPPADILNRILSEFITARSTVAYNLTPTIFKVFGTARAQGQQSLVVEWILLSLTNFTRAPIDASEDSVWNILCFFVAASNNPWFKSVFPLISRPVKQNDSLQVDVFVASTLDFRSQLDDHQRSSLASIFKSARGKSSFFLAVDAALNNLL